MLPPAARMALLVLVGDGVEFAVLEAGHVHIADLVYALLGQLLVEPVLVPAHSIQHVRINPAVHDHWIAHVLVTLGDDGQAAVLLDNAPLDVTNVVDAFGAQLEVHLLGRQVDLETILYQQLAVFDDGDRFAVDVLAHCVDVGLGVSGDEDQRRPYQQDDDVLGHGDAVAVDDPADDAAQDVVLQLVHGRGGRQVPLAGHIDEQGDEEQPDNQLQGHVDVEIDIHGSLSDHGDVWVVQVGALQQELGAGAVEYQGVVALGGLDDHVVVARGVVDADLLRVDLELGGGLVDDRGQLSALQAGRAQIGVVAVLDGRSQQEQGGQDDGQILVLVVPAMAGVHEQEEEKGQGQNDDHDDPDHGPVGLPALEVLVCIESHSRSCPCAHPQLAIVDGRTRFGRIWACKTPVQALDWALAGVVVTAGRP